MADLRNPQSARVRLRTAPWQCGLPGGQLFDPGHHPVQLAIKAWSPVREAGLRAVVPKRSSLPPLNRVQTSAPSSPIVQAPSRCATSEPRSRIEADADCKCAIYLSFRSLQCASCLVVSCNRAISPTALPNFFISRGAPPAHFPASWSRRRSPRSSAPYSIAIAVTRAESDLLNPGFLAQLSA